MTTNLFLRLAAMAALWASLLAVTNFAHAAPKSGNGNRSAPSGGPKLNLGNLPAASRGGSAITLGNVQNQGLVQKQSQNGPQYKPMPGRISGIGQGSSNFPTLGKPKFDVGRPALGNLANGLPKLDVGSGQKTGNSGHVNLGQFDIGKIANTRLDFPKGGIGLGSQGGIAGKTGVAPSQKCIKPWNPWCHSHHPWYPCGIFHNHCHPCWHWNPCYHVVFIDCLPVYLCDPYYHYVPVVVAVDSPRADLELLDLRLVDLGLPQANQGPCYRLMVRNNSLVNVVGEFQVTLLASQGAAATAESARGHGFLNGLAAGQTAIVDVRLPLTVVSMNGAEATLAFDRLTAVVDSRQQVAETSEANNASVFDRTKVATVNPLVIGFEQAAAGELMILGNGFGDASGQAYLTVNGVKLKLDVAGWSGQALKVRLPEVSYGKETKAQLIVIRSDGETSQPTELPLPDAV